ncbi:hypothetical protein KJ632_00345 [Patescibacteria group bacterium]|nr:hypothetical protein [Patescibacteria group bacterium]
MNYKKMMTALKRFLISAFFFLLAISFLVFAGYLMVPLLGDYLQYGGLFKDDSSSIFGFGIFFIVFSRCCLSIALREHEKIKNSVLKGVVKYMDISYIILLFLCFSVLIDSKYPYDYSGYYIAYLLLSVFTFFFLSLRVQKLASLRSEVISEAAKMFRELLSGMDKILRKVHHFISRNEKSILKFILSCFFLALWGVIIFFLYVWIYPSGFSSTSLANLTFGDIFNALFFIIIVVSGNGFLIKYCEEMDYNMVKWGGPIITVGLLLLLNT